MKRIRNPKLDCYFEDGYSCALKAIYDGMQLVVESEDEFLISLRDGLQNQKGQENSTEGLLDFWGACY